MRYKGEFWTNGVNEKIHPDIVIQIKMKDKNKRQEWTDQQKVDAKVWMIKQLDRLNDCISDL